MSWNIEAMKYCGAIKEKKKELWGKKQIKNYKFKFVNYNDYLNSNDWKKLRSKKLKGITRKKCEFCGSQHQLLPHHLIYRNWIDVTKEDLVVACKKCHELIHGLIKDGKLKYISENVKERLIQTKIILAKEKEKYHRKKTSREAI